MTGNGDFVRFLTGKGGLVWSEKERQRTAVAFMN